MNAIFNTAWIGVQNTYRSTSQKHAKWDLGGNSQLHLMKH